MTSREQVAQTAVDPSPLPVPATIGQYHHIYIVCISSNMLVFQVSQFNLYITLSFKLYVFV